MKKLLLMGSSGAGKTSMHSVIFANFPAKDTAKIGYTVEKQQHKFKLMGNLVLNLLDCGGQPTFMEQYFLVQRQTIFRGVQVLIYVFDIEDKGQKLAKSLQYWGLTLQSVQHYNENAKIFVLIHKIDKVPNDERELMIESKKQQIQSITELKKIKVTNFFATSIWDETLYQAWSKIVQSLIPNHDFINQTLKQLCLTCHVNQAVLFERSTFLILSYYNNQNNGDMLTYEKIANIIKQFKLTCNKYGGNIELIQVNTSSFTGIIQQFTRTENILVINQNKNQNIRSQLLQLNITNLGKYFNIKKNQFIQKENT